MAVISNPMLSVILIAPSSNSASIEAALLSLLGQTYRPCEVVLVMPKPESKEQSALFEELKLRWGSVFSSFKLVQMDGAEEVNAAWYAKGLKEVTGQYLALLNESHRVYPYVYSSLIQFLQDHASVCWAFANIGIALTNDHDQVIKRMDPDPTHHYVGVDYLEKEAIRLPGLLIDRARLSILINLEQLLSKTSIAEVIALLVMETKPGHLPMLGGEIRRSDSKGDLLKGQVVSTDEAKTVLPWWLHEFQRQTFAQTLLYNPKIEPSLHQTLIDEQSSYYRQLYMTYRQSTSGKIVRVLLRNYEPAKELHNQIAELPKTEIEAINKILLLQSQPLWELMAPVRWFGKLRTAFK
jgi:hypothetical protein